MNENLKITRGDILETKAQIILQQCNCVSLKGKGLYNSILEKYPHADFYSQRKSKSVPGTIKLAGNKSEKYIVALFAQYNPGGPREGDTKEDREKWFENCLEKVSRIKNIKSVAIPYKIGCGLAKGNWDNYFTIINKWAYSHPAIKVEIVQKDEEDRLLFLEWVYKKLIGENIINEDKLKKEYYQGIKNISWENSNILEACEELLSSDWNEFFSGILKDQEMIDTNNFLSKESESFRIFPELCDVFNPFKLCELSDLKVIILGQDPYHTEGAAMGLAFSHKPTRNKLQPSIRNIYKCLENDGYTANWESGNLEKWAKQGVLLVNTALTVREGSAGSHSKNSKSGGPWNHFITKLFIYLDEHIEDMTVVLWGSKAKEYSGYFRNHQIISSCHPAASLYNPSSTEFIDHKPFSRINDRLRENNKEEIDWNLV